MTYRRALPWVLTLLLPTFPATLGLALPNPEAKPDARAGGRTDAKKDQDYIKVEVRGTLHAGNLAIGGETTGVTVTARGLTWELDFGKNRALQMLADMSDGKTVVVTGTLDTVRGVEIRERHVVLVTGMRPG